ncbi:MAG: M48 family metallopeptidase [Proteobacteria bacterium]|nr:M48 family metallopeptidase [Pseudomonadota bacterium]
MITSLARFFDGKTAKPHSVLLELTETTLQVKNDTGDMLGYWPYEVLRDQNAGKGRDEVSLSVGAGDHARIIVSDTVFINELEKKCPDLRKRRPTSAGWWKPYAYWGGGAALSLIVLFAFVLPFLSLQIARWVPDDIRADIGAETQEFFVKSIAKREKIPPETAICMSGDGQKHLDTLISNLAAGLPEELPEVEVTVLKTKGANAFALPGGRLLVFSGLIDLADSPNGLAGVLAHELAHAHHRHPTQLIVSNAGIATVFSLLLGDVSGGTFLATMGQMAVGSAYSRDYEREADETGIELMRAAQYDISPMIPLMQTMAKKNEVNETGVLSLVNTHPGTEERVTLLEEAGTRGGPALSPEEWSAVKAICK